MDKFPSWRYGPNGQSGVFESEADVPTGWVDHPSLVKSAAPVSKAAPKTAAVPKAAAAAKKPGRKPKPKTPPLDL